MKNWLLTALVAMSCTVSAEQTLLQQMCETTASNQKLTVTMATPIVIAHHRNGKMLSGKESDQIDVSKFAPLLVGDNKVSEDCLAYLQHKNVLRVEKSDAEIVDHTDPILARVFFEFDRSQLSETSVRILEHIATKLNQSSNLITLEGHTDSQGSETYNMALGLRRSSEVKEFLADKGINPETMQATSKGETEPAGDNSTREGREKNRRVEIKI